MKTIITFILFSILTLNLYSQDQPRFHWRYQCASESMSYKYVWETDETADYICPTNASHTISVGSAIILKEVPESQKTDSEGRLVIKAESFNSKFKGMWTSSSDYINVATPSLSVRNLGERAYWETDTETNLIHPASATSSIWPSDADDCYSAYQANGLKHFVFSGQPAIPSGWKRKRLRFLFKDTINLKQGLIKFKNAQHDKIYVDSYIVQRNPSFNHASPTHEFDNPVAIISTTYVTGINMEGDGYEDFTEEKASEDLPFYMTGVGPVLELWVEVTYDPSAFTTTPCTGSARAHIYREKTYGF